MNHCCDTANGEERLPAASQPLLTFLWRPAGPGKEIVLGNVLASDGRSAATIELARKPGPASHTAPDAPAPATCLQSRELNLQGGKTHVNCDPQGPEATAADP